MSHHLETAQSLRKQGYRLTPQRLSVLEVIKTGPGHMSLNDVVARAQAQNPSITVPTVYRILQWLKTVNLVAETDLGSGCHVYEYVADNHHHHLVCLRCQHVIDLPESFLERLRTELRQQYGFVPCMEHLGLFGICPDCQGRERRAVAGLVLEGSQ